MVDRIRWDTVSYLPFYYVFFQFLLLTIFNLQANILTTKDILSNLEKDRKRPKRAEKDQKELDKKSRKGPKRTIIETKIWIIFTQELIWNEKKNYICKNSE